MKLFLNGASVEIEADTLVDLLTVHDIDHERNGIAIALNGDVIPRSRWTEHRLCEGDEVEVITAMQGG